MNVTYNQQNQTFKLDTKNSSYIIKVALGGFLTHLYYGKRLYSDDLGYVLYNHNRGMTTNPIESGADRSFSLDTLPLEYPTYGIGDFRPSALMIELEDGSTATDIRYLSHRIYKGKQKLKGLPATYADEKEAMGLEIICEDPFCASVFILSCI